MDGKEDVPGVFERGEKGGELRRESVVL